MASAEQLNSFLVDMFGRINKIEERTMAGGLGSAISITEIHIIEKIGAREPVRMGEIALSVARFRWGIYSANFGVDFSGIVGMEAGYAAAVLLERIREALRADSRVLGVEDYRYRISGDFLTASLTVRTVFGDVPQTVEVRAN